MPITRGCPWPQILGKTSRGRFFKGRVASWEAKQSLVCSESGMCGQQPVLTGTDTCSGSGFAFPNAPAKTQLWTSGCLTHFNGIPYSITFDQGIYFMKRKVQQWVHVHGIPFYHEACGLIDVIAIYKLVLKRWQHLERLVRCLLGCGICSKPKIGRASCRERVFPHV